MANKGFSYRSCIRAVKQLVSILVSIYCSRVIDKIAQREVYLSAEPPNPLYKLPVDHLYHLQNQSHLKSSQVNTVCASLSSVSLGWWRWQLQVLWPNAMLGRRDATSMGRISSAVVRRRLMSNVLQNFKRREPTTALSDWLNSLSYYTNDINRVVERKCLCADVGVGGKGGEIPGQDPSICSVSL
jgi:hypothetical protein